MRPKLINASEISTQSQVVLNRARKFNQDRVDLESNASPSPLKIHDSLM